jgi:hypothetical protein
MFGTGWDVTIVGLHEQNRIFVVEAYDSFLLVVG